MKMYCLFLGEQSALYDILFLQYLLHHYFDYLLPFSLCNISLIHKCNSNYTKLILEIWFSTILSLIFIISPTVYSFVAIFTTIPTCAFKFLFVILELLFFSFVNYLTLRWILQDFPWRHSVLLICMLCVMKVVPYKID